MSEMRRLNFSPITADYFFERSMPEPNSGCWIWLNAASRNGYGAVRVDGKTVRAHRLIYMIVNGIQLPERMRPAGHHSTHQGIPTHIRTRARG